MAEIPRTRFAQKALDFAQLFSISFEQPIVSGKTTYRLEMSGPEGPSTGGGVQGVQHISLVPHEAGASIVVGSANRTTMNAQLRTLALLKDIHLRRSPGADFPVEADIYRDVYERLTRFFDDQGMKVGKEDVERDASSQSESARPFPVTLALAAASAAVALGAAVWFILTKGH